jgi:hypothetical protein
MTKSLYGPICGHRGLSFDRDIPRVLVFHCIRPAGHDFDHDTRLTKGYVLAELDALEAERDRLLEQGARIADAYRRTEAENAALREALDGAMHLMNGLSDVNPTTWRREARALLEEAEKT